VLVHVGSRVEFAEHLLTVLRASAVGIPVSSRATEATGRSSSWGSIPSRKEPRG
jgi:hypothetical protein